MNEYRKPNHDNSSLLGKHLDNLEQLIPGTNYILGKTVTTREHEDPDDYFTYLATDQNVNKWVINAENDKNDNQQKLLHYVNYIGRNEINNKYKFINLKTNQVEEYSDGELMDNNANANANANANTNIWEINQNISSELSDKIISYLGGKLRKRNRKSIKKRKRKSIRKK
jgi:hypothetical protein